VRLDEYDLKILNLLRENSRLSISEISKILGISRPTVKSKIERMEREGIIKGYTVKLSDNLVKENFVFAIVEANDVKDVLDRDDVVEVHRIASNKFLVKFVVGDFEALREIAKDLKIVEFYAVVESWTKERDLKLKVDFKCDYCGKETFDEPLVYKFHNKVYLLCCPTCLDEFKKLND